MNIIFYRYGSICEPDMIAHFQALNVDVCKIYLNMTIKPIQTGLPLRIFDIMGCGGFLMTNYQAELPEYFEIGTDWRPMGVWKSW